MIFINRKLICIKNKMASLSLSEADKLAFENMMETMHVKEFDGEDVLYNHCPNCKIPMTISNNEYHCENCGLSTASVGSDDVSLEATSGAIRIGSGPNKGRFYNYGGDYARTQRQAIMKQLTCNTNEYHGSQFPPNILARVATIYNTIQKQTVMQLVSFGQGAGIDGEDQVPLMIPRRNVWRGDIKDEILASLIYFVCIDECTFRKKGDIADFMHLPSKGFSRGEEILRMLHAEGNTDIPVCEAGITGFTDRYLEALCLDDPRYELFITEICNLSETKKMGMSSKMSSKVVGTLWIIIENCKLNITLEKLDKATDKTKKSTFIKFSRVVADNMGTFGPIFDKYKIPRRKVI